MIALAQDHSEIFDAALIAACASIVVAIITTTGAIIARRFERHVKHEMDTGNGATLGETVHSIAQLQEVQATQLHTNTKMLTELSDDVRAHQSAADHMVRETGPLIEWVREQMKEQP